jgi:hypothetical protein
MTPAIWELIAKVGLYVIELIFKKVEEREQRQKDFLKFIKSRSENAYSSLALRGKYRDIMERIKRG